MFDFPVAAYIKFKRNFLRAVVFQFLFDETDRIMDKKGDIITLLISKFPRINDVNGLEIKIAQNKTPIIQSKSNIIGGFEMRSQDGKKIIVINKTSIRFTIEWP